MLYNVRLGTHYTRLQSNHLIRVPKKTALSLLSSADNKGLHDNDIFYTVADFRSNTVFVAKGETFDTIFRNIRKHMGRHIPLRNAKADFEICAAKQKVSLRIPDTMMRALIREEARPSLQIDEYTRCLVIRPESIAASQDHKARPFAPT